MSPSTDLAPLLERFFTRRLMQERRVSPHTIGSYRDTFRLFLKFAEQRLHKAPCRLLFEDVDAPLVTAFLDHLEKQRSLSVRSRNLRLTAVHSFFRYMAYELPTHSAQIQRVLAIPSKRFTRTLVRFLTRPEVDALLAAPDQRTWIGRRDHAFILTAVQTGLRLSEITAATREDLLLGTGAHIRVIGKGRKERCTPLAKPTVAVLKGLAPSATARRWTIALSERERRAAECPRRPVHARQARGERHQRLLLAQRKTSHSPPASPHHGTPIARGWR
jgi:site-specific recombinase XerD